MPSNNRLRKPSNSTAARIYSSRNRSPYPPLLPSSQRSHHHAILDFIDLYSSESGLAFNKVVVTRYRMLPEQRHCASSTINLRLAAVRRLAMEAADSGWLSSEFATGIRRVKGVKETWHPDNWLTI